MPKKKKCPPLPPNMSYMVSFGDTMTALLAFFIVLNSMAESQTGANLHAGTGSFVTTTSSFGLPGSFQNGRSKQIFQNQHSSPTYAVSDKDKMVDDGDNSGPDDDADDKRVVDYHKEQFQRFLNALQEREKTNQESDIDGEVSFDIKDPLPHEGPVMNEEIEAAIKGVAHKLRQPNAEVELVVWCTSTSEAAWQRAIRQARELRQDTIRKLRLPPDQQTRLTAVAKPWMWEPYKQDEQKFPGKDTIVKRPGASVVVRETKPHPDPR